MKELEDLNNLERSVLLACCNANKFSLGSHVSIEIIRRKTSVNPKDVKRILRMLISNGFISQHPTRGSMTYQLTKKGWIEGCQIQNQCQ